MNIVLGSKTIATGTVDDITATFTPPPSPILTDRALFFIECIGANTGAVTFSPNGAPAHPVISNNGSPLVAGDIAGAGFVAILWYRLATTSWILLNPKTSASSIPTLAQVLAAGNSTGGQVIVGDSGELTLIINDLIALLGFDNGTISANAVVREDFTQIDYNNGTTGGEVNINEARTLIRHDSGILVESAGTISENFDNGAGTTASVTLGAPSAQMSFTTLVASGLVRIQGSRVLIQHSALIQLVATNVTKNGSEIATAVELALKEDLANKGAANGYTPLGGDTKVPSIYLPSYVDDVLEFANFAALPVTGETGKIYITIDNNKQFRWTGTVYSEITSSPGSTDAVPEGVSNLYFTTARVLATLLTGLNVALTGAIVGTDTILEAFGKIQNQISLRELLSNKDSSNGYVGLTLFKINFRNAANTFTSFFQNSNTAARTYTFQDSDDTIVGRATTDTLTNKRNIPMTVDVAPSATPIIDSDVTRVAEIAGLNVNISNMSTNLTGTPQRNELLQINITDNGTPRTLAWGTSFTNTSIALPTTTIASTKWRILFQWSSVTSKWEIVAIA